MDSVLRLSALFALVVLLPTLAHPQAANLSPEDRARISASLQGRVPGLLGRYQLWDAANRNGMGNSDARTSGGLGWGEASYLRDYLYCYEVSQDTYWLDKFVSHWDRMLANLKPNPQGFRAWGDADYSVSVIEARPVGDVGALTLTPASQRPWARADQPKATGHRYLISFPAPDSYVLTDATTNQEVARAAYTGTAQITQIPPGQLTLAGPAKTGATFEVTTLAPEPCEYQVHDGMVTYRLAQFLERVTKSPELQTRYGAKAAQYLAFLDRDVLQKWESTWLDLPEGAGLYKFSDNPTQRFPGGSLPHNQYLALARTWLVLADLPGYANAGLCLQRATAMARYFKQNLRLVKDAYDWYYWDPLPTEDIRRHTEDWSHATIDIGFAIEACRRGVVFDEEDLRRFARTYIDVMWNQDSTTPRFGRAVNTRQGDQIAWSDWVELAPADLRVWEVGLALYRSTKYPTSQTPTMLYLYNQLVGVSEQDRAACRETTAELTKADKSVLLNPGFELGDAEGPLLWVGSDWSPGTGQSEVQRVLGGHSGQACVALVGKGEKVNLVVQSTRREVPTGASRLVATVWYRTEGAATPRLAILGYDAAGKRLQYEDSPLLTAAQEWTQAQHSFKLKPGVVTYELLLRNGSAGTVWYDDVATSEGK